MAPANAKANSHPYSYPYHLAEPERMRAAGIAAKSNKMKLDSFDELLDTDSTGTKGALIDSDKTTSQAFSSAIVGMLGAIFGFIFLLTGLLAVWLGLVWCLPRFLDEEAHVAMPFLEWMSLFLAGNLTSTGK